ncbi:hypothetical protein FS837_007011 [Tulasnella sp. UAMH 9824]|nr:hypothetical protein FS837_007011 [Tulasnella sp. UAMH 9824]
MEHKSMDQDYYPQPTRFSKLVYTPNRTIPDHLGNRNRGRHLTEMYAPSQYAQETSTVQRPTTRAPALAPERLPAEEDTPEPPRANLAAPLRALIVMQGLHADPETEADHPIDYQITLRIDLRPIRTVGILFIHLLAPPLLDRDTGPLLPVHQDLRDLPEEPIKVDVPHIEMKLKPEHIENGTQLGSVVPTRFKRNAKTRWQSLPWDRRTNAAKLRAKNATSRDTSAPREKPSEYYIRELKLLHTAELYTETELILAIMEGAPKYWHSVIDTSTLQYMVDLQDKIIYHEDALMYGPGSSADGYDKLEKRIRAIEQGQGKVNRYSLRVNQVEAKCATKTPPRGKAAEGATGKEAHAHLIGFHKDLGKSPYPRDDKTLAKGKSPEEKGARPCCHCGSPKHWDNECKYARKGAKRVRTNFASPSDDYLEAMSAYEEAYLDDNSNEEAQEEAETRKFEETDEEDPESEN